MQKPKLIQIFYILSIFTIYFCSNLEIHILNADYNPKKERLRQLKQQLKKMATNDSQFSKICNSVFTTYQYMGERSLSIYKGCQGDFELLGKSDRDIIKSRPFCFDAIDQFFCNYKIQSTKINTETEENSCGNEKLIKLILSIIKGCLTESADELKQTKNYKCPGLDDLTYKIWNPKSFCRDAEMKEMLAPTENFDNGATYQYSTVSDKDFKECEYITGMYNSCIDADNLLFPDSNYKKCFHPKNTMYFCNKLERYSKSYSKMCSNYVLPTLAHLSLHSNLFLADREICDEFEEKIMKTYDRFMNVLKKKISSKELILSDIKQIFQNNNHLKKFSYSLLNATNHMSKKWMTMYPEFSTTFKIRKNLTEVEFEKISKLRTSFDDFYPFAANLKVLANDKKFMLANFTSLFSTVNNYYAKAKLFVDDMADQFKDLEKLLVQNKNLTYNHHKPEVKKKFMISQFVKSEEVVAFQNEYVQIIANLKKYMNVIMKKIRDTNIEYTQRKIKVKADIRKVRNQIEKIKNQKQTLYNILLE